MLLSVTVCRDDSGSPHASAGRGLDRNTNEAPATQPSRHPGPSPARLRIIRRSKSNDSNLECTHYSFDPCTDFIHRFQTPMRGKRGTIDSLCSAHIGSPLVVFRLDHLPQDKSVRDFVWRRFATTERHTHFRCIFRKIFLTYFSSRRERL